MEDYIHTISHRSSQELTGEDIKRFRALLEPNKGIENLQISPDNIYLEYNPYIYSSQQVEEILYNNGFRIRKEKKPGFLKRQLLSLADSNRKTFGDRKPDCCH